MPKKFKEKYNEGCIKVFQLLNLLYEDKAEYNDVMAIFSGTEPDAEKQHVTLNKFLNTLKVFGMIVQKRNGRFETKNLPFSLKFDIDDLKSINLFEHVAENLPSSKNKINLEEFVKFIEARFDDKTQIRFNSIKSNDNTDYSFYYSNLREQLELCEQYCQVNYKVRVIYLKNGEQVSVECNASKVVYDNKNAYLRIYKITEQLYEDILITDIISVSQLPTAKFQAEMPTTVVFRLTGRLAKAYQLKENESINTYEENGAIVVSSKGEPIDILLSRLMRYDYDCEVIRPKFVRTQMIEKINNTLKNYE